MTDRWDEHEGMRQLRRKVWYLEKLVKDVAASVADLKQTIASLEHKPAMNTAYDVLGPVSQHEEDEHIYAQIVEEGIKGHRLA